MRIKIAGDYKWLSTIEFLREARNRCKYKLICLANNAKNARWPGTVYTLADDSAGMGEWCQWSFSERTTPNLRLDDFYWSLKMKIVFLMVIMKRVKNSTTLSLWSCLSSI